MQNRKAIRDKVSNFLKSRVIDLALGFIASKAAWLVSGPWGWLTNMVLVRLWNRFGAQGAKWAMRMGALGVDLGSGSIKVYKINKAKDENKPNDYWTTISGI